MLVFSGHMRLLAAVLDATALEGPGFFAGREMEAREGSLSNESLRSKYALCRQGCFYSALQNKEPLVRKVN